MPRVPRFTQDNQNPVGMIVPSMLTEAQFQEINGANWVLARGQSVAGSKYATVTGSGTVPDLRGMALRGKNNGRADGNQDPGGERALGDFQNDQMQGHIHDQAAHGHAIQGGSGGLTEATNGTSRGLPGLNGANTGYVTNVPSGGMPYVQQADPAITGPVTDGTNGTPRTGSDTRMRNIAVNYFIKIN